MSKVTSGDGTHHINASISGDSNNRIQGSEIDT